MRNNDTLFGRLFSLLLVGTVAMASPTVAAEQSDVKQGAKEVGRAVGSVVGEIGQGAKRAGKAVGNAAKEGVDAVKEGGREFKRAVKEAR